MYQISDDIPEDDEVVGDHPEPDEETVKAKVVKTTSKGVLVK